MSTTTEPLTRPITAQDKKALRHADSIVFRLYKGQATIEANRDGRHSPDGFDQKHTIYVGGAHVTDYGREHTHVPYDEQHRYSGFSMAITGCSFNQEIRTLVDRMRIGGTLELHWIRNNASETSRELGFVVDELKLHVFAPVKDEAKGSRADVYNVDTYWGRDNSARMVRVDGAW